MCKGLLWAIHCLCLHRVHLRAPVEALVALCLVAGALAIASWWSIDAASVWQYMS